MRITILIIGLFTLSQFATSCNATKSIASIERQRLFKDGMFRLSEMHNNGTIASKQLVILIDSLQRRSVRIAAITAKNKKAEIRLETIKELNSLFWSWSKCSSDIRRKPLRPLKTKQDCILLYWPDAIRPHLVKRGWPAEHLRQ